MPRPSRAPSAPAAPDLQDSPQAWLVVVAAFVAMFTSFGVAYSFGAFLQPMSEALGSGPGATAAVFSLTTMALFGLGALSGPAVDRFGPRRVVLVGALAMGLGLLLTSRATALWQAYVGHGLGVGLGVACSYVPLVAVVGGWFTRRRTLAVGIAVSGIGLGTLLVAPLAADLIDRYGWRQAYLILAAVSTVALAGCGLLVRAAPVTTQGEAAPLLPRLRTPTYLRLYASGLLLSVVLFVPFVHLPAYAASRGAGDVAAATLVGVIGAASIVGRLALGAAAARTGVLRTYQACFALMAGSFLCWLGAPGYPRLVVFAVLLGIGYGGFVALGPALVAHLFGVRGLGGLLGVLYTCSAVGSAIGPPAAGAMIGATGEYLPVILAALAIGAAATATVLTVHPPHSVKAGG
ncbi:MAG TPA: MFS transporter [Mycobacteriales bacterium]|nr:MFS transporter [Mycobacteriales bacterium]